MTKLPEFERRTFAVAELRTVDSNDVLSIEGRAAGYNVLSADLGGFREKIAPGAFRSVIESNADIACLFNHDPNQILGRTSSKTLQLVDAKDGLRFRCELPDSQSARDLHASIKRGDISGCSFSFRMSGDPNDESWNEVDDPDDRSKRLLVRTLRNIPLVKDIGPVVFPAYQTSTSVSARALELAPFTVVAVTIPPSFSEAAADAHNRMVQRRRDLLHQILS